MQDKSKRTATHAQRKGPVEDKMSSQDLAQCVSGTETDVACFDCYELAVWKETGERWHSFQDAIKAPFTPYKVGDTLGAAWTAHWFRIQLHLPRDCPAPRGTPLLLRWDSNCESLLWSEDGTPMCGLGGPGRNEAVVDRTVQGDRHYLLYMEAVCSPACDPGRCPEPYQCFTVSKAEAVIPNVHVQKVLADFKVVSETADSMPGTAVGSVAHETARDMSSVYRQGDPPSWAAARQLACRVICQRGASSRHKVFALGHCHLSTAVDCPFQDAHRRVARCFSTQLQLLRQHPQHRFGASQAQHFNWLHREYPGLFAEVLSAVQNSDTTSSNKGGNENYEGRFLLLGGSWVEMDTNMPSGESLVRQLLLGQRFYEQHMGHRCSTFWLCGARGLTAQLPQILVSCELTNFVGSLSRGSCPMTHNTFKWQSLDGTCLLTHFPPVGMATQATVADVMSSVQKNTDKGRAASTLLVFGDEGGGQGPTIPMCQSMERLADPQGHGIDGLVQMTQGSPSAFFRHIDTTEGRLISWHGEIPRPEVPGGISFLTASPALKAYNRTCERLLRDVEILGVIASVSMGYMYPYADIASIWRDLLLFQSNDIITGALIHRAYIDTISRYGGMLETLKQIRDEMLGALCGASPGAAFGSQDDSNRILNEDGEFDDYVLVGNTCQDEISSSSNGGGCSSTTASSCSYTSDGTTGGPARAKQHHLPWFFNSLAFSRSEVVEVDASSVQKEEAPQKSHRGNFVLLPIKCKPLCFTKAQLTVPEAPAVVLPYKQEGNTCKPPFLLRNAFIEVTINGQGKLTSLTDLKTSRQLLSPGDEGNQLRVSEVNSLSSHMLSCNKDYDGRDSSIGNDWNAVGEGASVEVVERGPLRVCLQVNASINRTPSSLQQLIFLDALSPCLTFATTVDWRVSNQALKVAFPWDLQANSAWYEVQFGAVSRPTGTEGFCPSVSEACVHRWSDLADGVNGVAMLNNCKYGTVTHASTQILHLIEPSSGTDSKILGRHEFSYAILPHQGRWQDAGVVESAAAFNHPLLLLPCKPNVPGWIGLSFASTPLFKVVPDGSASSSLILETIKVMESQAGTEGAPSIILRLYESQGKRGEAFVKVSSLLGSVSKVTMCNMLEDEVYDLEFAQADEGSCLKLIFAPWKITTLKVVFV